MTWIWVAIAVIALGLIAWAVLAGLPFGGDRGGTLQRTEGPAPATVGEGPGGGDGSTVAQIGEPAGITTSSAPPPRTSTTATTTTATTSTTTTTLPPLFPTTPPPSRTSNTQTTTRSTTTSAPPLSVPQRDSQPQPDTPPRASNEISSDEASSVLASYLGNHDMYGVDAHCLSVTNLGYRNVGYTLEVRDTCASRTLGRWRVDSKTREVFRQSEDGRFLKP